MITLTKVERIRLLDNHKGPSNEDMVWAVLYPSHNPDWYISSHGLRLYANPGITKKAETEFPNPLNARLKRFGIRLLDRRLDRPNIVSSFSTSTNAKQQL